MEKGISYLNRNFSDYKQALIEYSKQYYPDLSVSYDDASVMSWLIDLNADVADNLSYHIDRVYQETNIDSAQEKGSLYAIARNNGVKIPGPKGAMAEMKISFILPVSDNKPNYNLAPIVRRGTKFSSSSQQFELVSDVDFAHQFNDEGASDRTVVPNKNTNGIITGYTVEKRAVVIAGETRVYRQIVNTSDSKPFMELIIPVENVMNVESILVVDGTGNTVNPSYGQFYSISESGVCGNGTRIRYFEVDNLAQSEVWGESVGANNKAVRYEYGYSGVSTYCVTKGEWKPITHKFITEYTDKGYLKIIFGAGEENASFGTYSGSSITDFSKWQISRMINNKNLGVFPKANTTIFVLYRVGGGQASNVPKGSINKVTSLNADFRGDTTNANVILKTISVENTTPSVSGKDMPTEKEIKYLIKYHNAAQERCVTIKDYIDRILLLPPKYGTPFRVGVTEENNKIMVYLLGCDSDGHLDTSLPVTLIKNIERYLERYRMVNDFVEIKSGRIINLSFNVDVIIDKNYNKTDVVSTIIDTVENYMDINSHLMGEEIYMGDLEKEISKVDGVINLIDLRVYNEIGSGYSNTQISQEIISSDTYDEDEDLGDSDTLLIDLEATDGILYNDGDTMMEIKNPDKDIKVKVKER